MRVVTVDLDDPDPQSLELLWAELKRRFAPRQAEPDLYDVLCQRLTDIEDADSSKRLTCDAIRSELRCSRPSAVLSANWQELVEDKPALGAYLQGGVRRCAAA